MFLYNGEERIKGTTLPTKYLNKLNNLMYINEWQNDVKNICISIINIYAPAEIVEQPKK